MKTFLVVWLSCALMGDSLAERSLLLEKPTFESTNFFNILNWETIGEVPPGTVYDVEYRTYGDEWLKKSECQSISERTCNLTRETEIFKERYHAQVRAVVPNCCHSEWVESARFCPWETTKIGDLQVNCIPSARAVKFVVQPPYTPFRDEKNRLQTVEDIFRKHGHFDVKYQITIVVNKTQLTVVHDEKEFHISSLEPGTEYTGTIQMVYSDRKSNPYAFRVRTLSDNTWLSYLFGAAVFMIILICATICYSIYKYIKLHAVQQPRSLDLKDISHFQTLLLPTEHILTLHDPSKPPRILPVKLAQINHQLQEVLEHPTLSALSETSYRQQAKAAPFQTLARPQDQADDPPVGYAPQVAKKSPSGRLDDNPSSSTYGICVEGAGSLDKTGFPPSQGLRLESLVEAPISYKAQTPTQVERGWCEKRTQAAPTLVPENAGQTQQQSMPQQSPYRLQESVPTKLDEGPGSYRKQTMELSPSTLETAQNGITEDHNLLPAVFQSLLDHCACKNSSQEHSPGPRHVAWDSFPWTDSQWQPSGFQTTDPVTLTSKGLTNETESHHVDSLDFAPDSEQFAGLFRDLELKVLWDHRADENAEV